MRNGLEKLIENIENETYGFGSHERAANDYDFISSLRNRNNMTDKEIYEKFIYYDKCPHPEDFDIEFDENKWCKNIPTQGFREVCTKMHEICPCCWEEFLNILENLS